MLKHYHGLIEERVDLKQDINYILHILKGSNMSKTYKIIEVVGTSSSSYDDAIKNAISEASKSLKALSWFEVVQMRGGIKDGKIEEYQVILKVGFRLLD